MDLTMEPVAHTELEPGAVALFAALATPEAGTFHTLLGFDAYVLWVQGRLSNDTVAVLAGFCG